MTLKGKLEKLGACREAVRWAAEREWPAAWQECERGDWMLWLAGMMQGKKDWPTRQQIVLVACHCAELALPIFEKKYPDEKCVRECIETTRKWARGEASIEDVRKARAAAAAAYAAAAAADAAYAAAYAAAADAAYAAAAADAAAAAADAYAAAAAAAYAAAAAADAYAAADAARQDIQKKCADFCRKHLTVPEKW